jgi:hypothetical protein
LLIALGGLVLVLVGVVEARNAAKPADRLYECDPMLNCDEVAVIHGSFALAVAPWFVAALISLLGAALLLWARRR